MTRRSFRAPLGVGLALALMGGSALAQDLAPTPPPPPTQAAPDSGPPPADAPAAQSPAEMPIDEGTVNDLPAGNGAVVPPPAPPPASDAPPAPPPAPLPPTGDGAAATPPPADGVDVAAAVGALDPYIEDMQVVGPWTEGGEAGVWRSVMLREADDPEAYRFFVQSITDRDGTLVVRDTVEITELAAIEGGIVGYRADEGGEGAEGITLFFDIVPSDGEIAETYELHFFGAGQPYQFGPATN